MGETTGKVFAIGLARTGTTSLHAAFTALGLRSAPSSARLLADPHDALLGRYDAFADNPIPFLFPQLDRRFPNSRFVWVVRPVQEWLDSMKWLFDVGVPRLDRRTRRFGRHVHEVLYGTDRFDADVLRRCHRDHEALVGRYFADRKGDVVRIELADLGWEPLATHLGVPVPDVPFPFENRSGAR